MVDKKVKLYGLVLASVFLTSCSTAPSFEEQTKLVEYDNCLEYVIAEINQMTSTSGRNNKIPGLNLPETYNFTHNYERNNDYSDVLEFCEQYRPKS
jgi:hypothetical protein